MNRKNNRDELSPSDYEEINKVENDVNRQWNDNLNSCDSKTEFDCLTNTTNFLTDEYLDNHQLQMMINRYEQIINMKRFDNYQNTTMLTPLPDHGTLLTLSRVKLASDYRSGIRNIFLPNLNKDYTFWKLQLTQGTFLFDKMIAYAALRKDMYYLSEYLRNNEVTYEQEKLIESMLTQLKRSELDLSDSFKFDSRGAMISYANIEPGTYLYQPKATSNLYYKQIVEDFDIDSNLSLQAIIEKRKLKTKALSKGLGLSPKNLYNLMGKILVSSSGGDYDDYIVRGYDLNNIIKMVNVQFQIKQDQDKSIQSILNKQENLNPYNSQPFDYNDETREMSFDCLDNHSSCKIRI